MHLLDCVFVLCIYSILYEYAACIFNIADEAHNQSFIQLHYTLSIKNIQKNISLWNFSP